MSSTAQETVYRVDLSEAERAALRDVIRVARAFRLWRETVWLRGDQFRDSTVSDRTVITTERRADKLNRIAYDIVQEIDRTDIATARAILDRLRPVGRGGRA